MPNAQDWAKIDADEALEMLRSPLRWPLWPWLPMKRRKPDGQWPDHGRVFADFTDPNREVRLKRGVMGDEEGVDVFENHAALVAAGWIVD